MEVRGMTFKVLTALFALVLLFGGATFAQDRGNQDTLILLTNRPDVAGNDSLFIIEAWLYDDVDTLYGISFGFRWENPNLTLDSFQASPKALTSWSQWLVYEDNNKDLSNTNDRAQYISLWLLSGTFWMPDPTRQLLGTYYFTLSSWGASDEIVIDTNVWSDSQEFQCTSANDPYAPYWFHPGSPIVVRDPSDAPGEADAGLPKTYSLAQNYPNPFNPTTTIEFAMPVAGKYDLTIYNVIGQVVDEFSGTGIAGTNTIEWDASSRASGVYFYKLDAGNFSQTRKMMLVK
jgi:hypothetical protein